MEAQDATEAMMVSKEDAAALQNMTMKGKRTKRQRPHSPVPFDIVSIEADHHREGHDQEIMEYGSNNRNRTTASEFATEEEQDMANCLILLAQGHEFRGEKPNNKLDQAKEQTAYECKTCNRIFPSFQALGGHRASHKKLKITDGCSSSPPPQHLFIDKCTIMPLPPLSLQLGHYSKPSPKNNKPSSNKVHECSICGTEFASGQALGGHMRRHRGLVIGNNNNNNKTGAMIDTITTLSLSPVALMEPDHHRENNSNIKGLSLDLNLPVPEEEPPSNDDVFHFAAEQTRQDRSAIVYTPPALVDCRY